MYMPTIDLYIVYLTGTPTMSYRVNLTEADRMVQEMKGKYRAATLGNGEYRDWETDRKSTRLNSSHSGESRMPSSA